MDAAFVWSGNGLIYFFKNGDYYRFDPEERPPVKDTYPKPISNWEGIPNNVDDALKYTNGYTYFFKDGKYWRFDDRAFKVRQTRIGGYKYNFTCIPKTYPLSLDWIIQI